MSKMEQVARALCVQAGHAPDVVNSCDGSIQWRAYVADARAAIEAMREPTPGMMMAALRAHTTPTDAEFGNNVAANPARWERPAWQAAIDAALEEGV